MDTFGIAEKAFEELIVLFSQNSNIEKVVLFGSRAMDKYKDGSDIDLALYGTDIKLNDQLDLSSKVENLEYPYSYDFQIYKNIKYKDDLDHINRVGIIIYQKE
jgi:predicted nucleotidyltransferase